MIRGTRKLVGAALISLISPLVATAAPSTDGEPPQRALVVPNGSMAEAEIGQYARLSEDGKRLEGKALEDWGIVKFRRCLFDEECTWDVPGGGGVDIAIDPDRHRLIYLATTSRHWETALGVRAGSSRLAVKRAYPDAVREEICVPGDGEGRGLFLPRRNRTTMFQIGPRTSKVIAIHIFALPLQDINGPC